jgi:hypothetical protein
VSEERETVDTNKRQKRTRKKKVEKKRKSKEGRTLRHRHAGEAPIAQLSLSAMTHTQAQTKQSGRYESLVFRMKVREECPGWIAIWTNDHDRHHHHRRQQEEEEGDQLILYLSFG